MKTCLSHVWKGTLVAGLLLLGLRSSTTASELSGYPDTVTLSVTFREPEGVSGTVDFTFALEESSTLPVLPIPEPSTLVLVAFGIFGVIALKKFRFYKLLFP